LNNYGQVKRDLDNLIKDRSVYVTTFFDYYGLPSDFPGYKEISKYQTTLQKVEHIEKMLYERIGSNRFIPFIQLHEFESLLFSNITGFNTFFSSQPADIGKVQAIITQFPNPEDINDNPRTAPSKRLISILPNYNKPLQGALIAIENGIEETLAKCPHFSAWINKLISLEILPA
jgi:hypothetical protein